MKKNSPQPETEPENPPPSDHSIAQRARAQLLKLTPPIRSFSFETLYRKESEQLDQSRGIVSEPAKISGVQVRAGESGEPAVCFTPCDRFGLALSGGGIRSATFNLGLLQTLARLGILPHVDYLSTVSGGGYVGAFWTAWLHRRGEKPGAARFPLGNDNRGGERAEIRHLREFSRFLLPRMGIFQTEFWAIVMTVLGGMLPSFLAALAVLGTAWYLWVLGLVALTLPGAQGISVSALALLFYLTLSEIKWRKAGRAERNPVETRAYVLTALAMALWLFFAVRWGVPVPDLNDWSSFARPAVALALPKALLHSTLALLLLRIGAARVCRAKDLPALTGLERGLTRMVGLTVGMTAIGGLWLLACKLDSIRNEWALRLTLGGTVASAGVFAWAKKWLTEPVQETRGGTFLQFAFSWLKRAAPKWLAGLTWLLLFVLTGSALPWWGSQTGGVLANDFWMPFAGCLAVLGLVAMVFDPSRVGMHEFYRARLARCYLGASHHGPDGKPGHAADNRQVAERPGDDLTLGQIAAVKRPIHLVCVAANDMSGDPLGSLYRGARSAVLSGQGISLGDQTAPLDDLRLSAAITASAAAFNSQMGRVSMDLGPAVGFLMSALNLRLGLWVPHPANPFRGRYLLPGRFFLAELLGISTTCGRNLHLSDGNHFENFGLYELVRRHCRYIIVSDCGADPEVAFDDLANVLRRLREDFGVEIDLDITPLRPGADKRAVQHAVVGTIHYNGFNGTDKGTLLFFKAALTGDEPPDVLQYNTRNGEFPHESTGDQFYDEAQWESYRRLGEHAAESVLGFFDASRFAEANVVDRLFRDARSRWQPAPDDHGAKALEISGRFAAFEEDIQSAGPELLKREFFAEADALASLSAENKTPVSPPNLETEIQILSYLVRIGQIMEDIWVTADLDRTWSHPLSEAWMNRFRRWAAMPSFRRWWPVIAPLYSPGLREFVRERFKIGAIDPSDKLPHGGQYAHLHIEAVDNPPSFFEQSHVARQFFQTSPNSATANHSVLAYALQLRGYDGNLSEQRLPVGLLLWRAEKIPPGRSPSDHNAAEDRWTVVWHATELFVPDALTGSGFISKFLDAAIRHFGALKHPETGRGYCELHVKFGPQKESGQTPREKSGKRSRTDRASRYDRLRDIEFYKSRGFAYSKAEDSTDGSVTLRLALRLRR